jgi:hypothetical protein
LRKLFEDDSPCVDRRDMTKYLPKFVSYMKSKKCCQSRWTPSRPEAVKMVKSLRAPLDRGMFSRGTSSLCDILAVFTSKVT